MHTLLWIGTMGMVAIDRGLNAGLYRDSTKPSDLEQLKAIESCQEDR
jgi:hypothetical protein